MINLSGTFSTAATHILERARCARCGSLCEYIDLTLSEHGVDVAALAARQGIDRSEITDRWRDW